MQNREVMAIYRSRRPRLHGALRAETRLVEEQVRRKVEVKQLREIRTKRKATTPAHLKVA